MIKYMCIFKYKKMYIFVAILFIVVVYCSYRPILSMKDPLWSPDGRYLAVDCSYGYENLFDLDLLYETCILTADMSEVIRIAPEYVSWSGNFKSWSHDGGLIVISQPISGLTLFNVNSKTKYTLIDYKCNQPIWSPDDSKIACINNNTLFLVDIYTKKVVSIYIGSFVSQLSWSSNNESIIYISTIDENEHIKKIEKIDINTQHKQIIVGNMSYGSGFSVSPDGKFLLYANYALNGVDVLDLHTGISENLLNSACIKGFHTPSWSYDGQYIVFTAGKKGYYNQSQVYLFNVNKKELFRIDYLIEDQSYYYKGVPSWSPDNTSIAIDVPKNLNDYRSRIIIFQLISMNLTPIHC